MKKLLKTLFVFALVMSMVACSNTTQPNTQNPSTITSGTYTASATGMHGDVTVEVTLDETSIKTVEVINHGETLGIGYGSTFTPVEVLPAAIVEHQTFNVDNVSGATITSNAIKNAVKDALLQANISEGQFATEVIRESATETEYNVDIVVVGGGVAGLMAANTALDQGKNVLLIEKLGILGGSTVMSGGNIFGAGTTAQKEMNIEDSPEDLYNFLMSYDENNQLNPEMVKDYAYGIANDIDYMSENGVKIVDVITAQKHTLIPNRLHMVEKQEVIAGGAGGYIIVPLTKSYESKGGQYLVNTKAEKLLTDENGKVIGLEASNKAGEIVTINSNSVILTTGGYSQNTEMTAKWADLGIYWSTAIGGTGDGLIMAEAVGAKIFDSTGMQLQYTSFITGETGSTAQGLVVDMTGNRLTNENGYQSVVAEPFKRAGNAMNYYITATKEGVCAEPYATVQYGVTVESIPHAGTIEELAKQINMEPEVLKATIDHYNELCANGEDTDFGKPAEFLIPVEGDTYYAIPQNSCAAATFGGLVIDGNGRVLNENNEVISGLFAAGEVALTGQFAEIYPSCGLAVGNSAHMGRKAALTASAE